MRFAPLVTHREGLGSTWFEAKFTGSQTASLLPIHFELKAPDGTRIPAAAGGELDTALPHGVACIIQMAPTRYRDAHLGNSRWFLELSDDGSPVIWERVPVPQIDDESVIRRLAVGPDHALYLMQVNAHEVSIYRR